MKRILTLIGIVVCMIVLILIRYFEASLFYDPLLLFFKTNYHKSSLPKLSLLELCVAIGYRYALNAIASLGILWFLFKKISFLKFSAYLYVIFFVIMLVTFIVLYQALPVGPHQPLFYVRRFLIQPILLFLLVPAFYIFKVRLKEGDQ